MRILRVALSAALFVLIGAACIPGDGSITGVVSYDTPEGRLGAAGITVELYPGDLTLGRPSQRITETDASGRYVFNELEAGCYFAVFVEPSGFSAPDANFDQLPNTRQFCIGQDEVTSGPNMVLVADDRMATISGFVQSLSGAAEALVPVEFFTIDLNGNRDQFVGDTPTDFNGEYSFNVAPGCYRLTFVAPFGRTFPGGTPDGRFYQPLVCVGAGEVDSNVNAFLN